MNKRLPSPGLPLPVLLGAAVATVATAVVVVAPTSVHAQQSTPPAPPAAVAAPSLPPGPPPGAPKVEAPPSAGQSLARQLNEAFISVFDHVAPAVVVVDVSKEADANDPTEYFGGDFFNFRAQPDEDDATPPNPGAPARPRSSRPQARRAKSEGSGFIFQPDGFILTNNHVVTGGSKIEVRLKDNRTLPARLVGADEKTDIAVLKVDARDLPTVEFTDSDAVRVGQLCFAIGVPFKQDYSFTQGVVSAKNRDRFGMAAYEDYIQTDASINPGNSGGPLLDLDGHVIGMNTLINGLNRGLGFAIPSNMLREIGGQLVKNGRIQRPYLGIGIQTLTEADAATRGDAAVGSAGVRKGVVVTSVVEGAPAARGDLRPTDVVTEVDGVAVATDRELQKQVLGKRIGQTVQLTVVRKGKTLRVPVITAELPGDNPTVASASSGGGGNTPPAGGGSPALPAPDAAAKDKDKNAAASGLAAGLSVEKLTRAMADSIGLESDAGVVVTAVTPDSPAGRAGVRVRDVITDAGDRPVSDPDALREVLRAADARRGVDLYIARGGVRTFVVVR